MKTRFFRLLAIVSFLTASSALNGCHPNSQPSPDPVAPARNGPNATHPVGPGGGNDGITLSGQPVPNDPKPPMPVERKIEVVEHAWPNGMPQARIEGYRRPDGEFVRHGVYMQYYDDGTKKMEIHYVDGNRHGPRVSWYPTGQIWARGEYDNERENGTWTAWWQNGFRQREWQMVRGTWHGLFTEWHDNGEKKMEFEYVEGLKQGPMTIWDPEGKVIHKTEFVNDVGQPQAP